MKTNLFLAFALVFLVRCAHQPSSTEVVSVRKASPLEWGSFSAEQRNREEALNAILGKMTVEFEGNDESVRGLGTSAAVLPSNYLLEIRDPVGRLHFQAVSRGQEFDGYFPRLNRVYHDKHYGKRFFQKTWSIPISFPELSRLSAGLLPKGMEALQPDTLRPQGEQLEGTLTVEGSEVVVTLKPEGTLSHLRWKRKEGEVEVSWRDFRPCCKWIGADSKEKGFGFAHVIEVKTKDSIILINWKSLQKWEKASPEAFNIKTGLATKVINLE